MKSNQQKNEKMICKLCGRLKKLRESHVIPEFIYAPLYDNKHRFHTLSKIQTRLKKLEQKGIRERLLCQDCETKLSRYETYASSAFEGKEIAVPTIKSKFKGITSIDGLDYEKFKLFQLSILWRAGVSDHEFFGKVELGSHEEIIKQMILNSDPGDPHQYGCTISAFVVNRQVFAIYIGQPTRTKKHGHLCYRFIFGGFFWHYFLFSQCTDRKIGDRFLTKDGRITISIDETRSTRFLKRTAQAWYQAGDISRGLA